MASPPPTGIYVPVPTFFTPSLLTNHGLPTLNLALQSQHTLHLARSGIRGLVLAGSTGEAVHLTRSERKTLISSTKQALDEAGFTDYPLIAGVASDSVEDAVGQLVDAAEAGAQWGMVLVPNYFAGAGRNRQYQTGLVEWFGGVAEMSPIPILIYHYPAVSNNVQVDVSTYATLANHPKIVGCKLSHASVSTHLQLASLSTPAKPFHVFSGLGQHLFPILCGGCHGAIDGLAGFFPKTLVALFKSANDFIYTEHQKAGEKAEKLEYVRKLQVLVSKAERFVEEEGTVGIKYAVGKEVFGELMVQDVEFVGRPPLLGGMSEAEYERWGEAAFDDMRKIEKSL